MYRCHGHCAPFRLAFARLLCIILRDDRSSMSSFRSRLLKPFAFYYFLEQKQSLRYRHSQLSISALRYMVLSFVRHAERLVAQHSRVATTFVILHSMLSLHLFLALLYTASTHHVSGRVCQRAFLSSLCVSTVSFDQLLPLPCRKSKFRSHPLVLSDVDTPPFKCVFHPPVSFHRPPLRTQTPQLL